MVLQYLTFTGRLGQQLSEKTWKLGQCCSSVHKKVKLYYDTTNNTQQLHDVTGRMCRFQIFSNILVTSMIKNMYDFINI